MFFFEVFKKFSCFFILFCIFACKKRMHYVPDVSVRPFVHSSVRPFVLSPIYSSTHSHFCPLQTPTPSLNQIWIYGSLVLEFPYFYLNTKYLPLASSQVVPVSVVRFVSSFFFFCSLIYFLPTEIIRKRSQKRTCLTREKVRK